MLNAVFTPWKMILGVSKVDSILLKKKMKILVGLRQKMVNILPIFWRYVILSIIMVYNLCHLCRVLLMQLFLPTSHLFLLLCLTLFLESVTPLAALLLILHHIMHLYLWMSLRSMHQLCPRKSSSLP